MEGARAGAGRPLSASGRPVMRAGRKQKGAAQCRPSMAPPRAYRWVSIMYIWITTSGENVNGTQP